MNSSSPSRKPFGENTIYDQMSEIIVDKSDIEYPNNKHYFRKGSKENMIMKENQGEECNNTIASRNSSSSGSSHTRRNFTIPNSQSNTIKFGNSIDLSDDVSFEKKAATRYRYKDAKSSIELCEFFQVNSFEVFDGEMMRKRFSTDFTYKDSFLWINPKSRSIHWSKCASDKKLWGTSKFISLDESFVEGFLRPEGDSRGVLKRVVIGKPNSESTEIVIHTESDDYLEITVSATSFPNWVKVLKGIVIRDIVDHSYLGSNSKSSRK